MEFHLHKCAFRHPNSSQACAFCGFFQAATPSYRNGYQIAPAVVYGKLCIGKLKYWLFGKPICPNNVPHHHVRCVVCKANWFESTFPIPEKIPPQLTGKNKPCTI